MPPSNPMNVSLIALRPGPDLDAEQDAVAVGNTFDDFRGWATGGTPHDDSRDVYPLSFMYGDMLWTGSSVRQRWRLISGNRSWRVADSSIRPLRHLPSEMPLNEAKDLPIERAEIKEDFVIPLRAGPSPAGAKNPTQASITRVATATAMAAAKPTVTTAIASSPPRVPPRVPPRPPTEANTRASSGTLASGRNQRQHDPYSAKDFVRRRSTAAMGGGGSSIETGNSSATASSITLTAPDKAVADWTVPSPRDLLSPHLQFARTINWATTPLGPMDSWSPEFRQIANLAMNNPHPVALFWGSDLTMLYNEAYAAEVAGNKHPSLMGTGFSGPFAELWNYTQPLFSECARTGLSIRKANDLLFINRHGLLEETFYSWSFVPLYGGTDRILGFYNAPFETTEQCLSQRRMQTIHKLGEHTAHAKTVKQFWPLVLEALEHNHPDVPFALLYSLGEADEGACGSCDHSEAGSSSGRSCSCGCGSSSSATMSVKTCHLEGSIAVPKGHVAAPPQLDLKWSRLGFVPSFREAMRTREPTLLRTRDCTLPEALLEGIEWRGMGDPCREAIILPVRPTNGDVVLAFLVLGVNPRRPYDDEYRAFISTLNQQLSTSLASAILFEDEVRRSRNAAETAALEREQLTEQLALQASRLRRMTELSPLGMFLISPEGVLREANDRFFEMTGHPRDIDGQCEFSWMDFIIDSSRQTVQAGWGRLVGDGQHRPWSGEVQLKKRLPEATNPVNLHGEAIDYWVMFNAHAELGPGPDHPLRSVMGSITDISHLKWAQGLQHRQLQEAEESRRRQNEFIDITSHEMRNPLSAILQCADDILSVLTDAQAPFDQSPPSREAVDSCVEAAHTISLCVQHQKSIVDDILTISKLDSDLLIFTPAVAQPLAILHRAIRMFDPELQAKGIDVALETDPSCGELGVDWVTVDPSRVLQILINLMTNAIKFTAPTQDRRITVRLAASSTPPGRIQDGGLDSGTADLLYVPPKTGALIDNTAATDDWGTGQVLYICFQVQDTGCGLTMDEKQILFQRFKQASPRTHAQYGGSGLGLFISKRLAEIHGGQIGVASKAGEGSLFGFFIQGQRSSPPNESREPVGVRPGAASLSDEGLPIDRHLNGPSHLCFQITPQRQDFASSGPGASLVATRAVADHRGHDDHERVGQQEAKDDPGADKAIIQILVAEDNLINQRVLVKQLRKAGCTVYTANDGIGALEFLERTHFRHPKPADGDESTDLRGLSIILMDLEMPNMDGLTCVREIRKMEANGRITGHVPVIAVTANVRDEQVAAARDSGMDDVVSKPFRIPYLLEKSDRLLRGPES